MSNLTSKLHETAPDTIWLCVSNEQGDYDEHFHTGNIEDVTWSDDKATEVAIEYRKVTPNDGKLVLHGKWGKVVCSDCPYAIGGNVFAATLSIDKGLFKAVVGDLTQTTSWFDTVEQAAKFTQRQLTLLYRDLSPNIVIVHDDTLPEFK